MSGIREEIARRHGLPASFAERLRGDTIEELEADAAVLAVTSREPQMANPNQGEMAALAAYSQRKGELVRRLFGESAGNGDADG